MSIVTTGQITVTDQNDGVSVRLSLESFVAPTAPDGSSPNLTGASTTLSVFLGAEDDSSSWTVTASPSSGVSGSLVGRTYTVTGLTVDSGFVDLTASRMGYSSITTRFAISKAKKGNRGTVNAARAISGTAWSDTEAATAVNSVAADAPVIGDVVTLYNSNANYSETRVRGSSTWTALTQYINGDLIVKNTIRASKIVIEDNSNIVPDADYEDADAWTPNGVGAALTIVPSTSEWNSTNLMQVSGGSTVSTIAVSKSFKVRPGDKLFWEFQAAVNGGTGSCYLQILYSDTRNLTSAVTSNVGFVSASEATTLNGETTVPAGVRFAVARLVKNGNGATSALFGRAMLRKKTDADLIVDGTVTTSKLDASAVTAEKVAANAITVEKMAIRSLQNLIENPDFENGAAHWTNPTRIVNKPTEAYRGSWVYEYVSASSAAALVSRSNLISVREGDSFYMRGFFKNTAGSTGSWYLQARFYDAAGATLPVINLVWTGENTTWSEKEKIVTAPAGAVTMAVILYSVGTGTAYWDEIYLMKAADGRLIVDGAIEAKHVSANAITAEKITADSITVSKILVQDNSNLVPDADFEDLDVWMPVAGTRVIEDAPSGWSSANVLRVRGAAGEIVGTVGKPFRIRAGDTLSVETELAVTGGVISANSVEFHLLTAAKRNMVGAVANVFLTTNAGTPQVLKSTFVVPSGTRFAQVFVRKLADSSTEVTLGRVVVRNRSTTDLLEDNAVSTIREATITSSTTFAAGTTWNTIGSYTFTPSGDYPLSLWLSGKAFLTIATAVDAIFDMRVLWRGAVQLTYTGAVVGKGPIDLTSLVSVNDRFTSGGATSGALEIQIRSTNGTCRLTNLRILLGEFKK